MGTLHFVLASAHALSSAAWFGSMFYSLTTMQPRARTYFASDLEFEAFVAHVAHGARWKVIGAFAFVTVTGAALIVVAHPTPASDAWLAVIGIKAALLIAAVLIFSYASWRLWPRRVFATPQELPTIRRQFRIVAVSLILIAAASFALGILPHTW